MRLPHSVAGAWNLKMGLFWYDSFLNPCIYEVVRKLIENVCYQNIGAEWFELPLLHGCPKPSHSCSDAAPSSSAWQGVEDDPAVGAPATVWQTWEELLVPAFSLTQPLLCVCVFVGGVNLELEDENLCHSASQINK